MARKVRTSPKGVPQLVQRIAKEAVPLWRTNADIAQFSEYLGHYARYCRVDVCSWSVSPHALHLLALPREEGGISRMLQSAGRQYAQYYNRQYERTGGMWYDRHRTSLVLDQSLMLPLIAFVESRAELSPYSQAQASSYGAHALGTDDTTLTFHPAYLALGSTPQERQQAYRNFYLDTVAGSKPAEWAVALSKQHALGDAQFIRRLEQATGRRLSAGKRGRPPKAH